MTSVSLSQLCAGIQLAVEESLPDVYWVVAEISELTAHRNGHCYLSLIEKGARGEPVAQVRGTIWGKRWETIRYQFAEVTGQPLAPGMRCLLAATVTFHPRYGLALDVRGVDTSFALGELAKARQAALEKLERRGYLALNKRFELPAVVQRLAVISSATAAGFQDFEHQLTASGYRFTLTLFPAAVQGADAPAAVRRALRAVAARAEEFDAVVIIRGGGAKTDLVAFDDYPLAAALARAPLPVLTGIGHERDESLADLVAHTRLKTPTAVAAFLIERAQRAEAWLYHVAGRVRAAAEARLTTEHRRFEVPEQRLPLLVRARLSAQESFLALAQARVHASDPARLLARGYTLTTRPDGQPLRFATDVVAGDELLTHFADGTVRSRAV
ncbi:MAG: exodeoxyribonuclease VII large subunit [Hymenobacteraceae bacterium]|nr:exodeoxyribonuclease VII large subunit [Hymenobacteraceae bacterium]